MSGKLMAAVNEYEFQRPNRNQMDSAPYSCRSTSNRGASDVLYSPRPLRSGAGHDQDIASVVCLRQVFATRGTHTKGQKHCPLLF